MVAYFKWQNNGFMLAGAFLMTLILAPFYKGWLFGQEFYVRAFFLALPVFAGIVAGRICASRWANRQLCRIDDLLYQQTEPERFIRVFAPLVERVPKETIEYVNGRIKLAYAYEAMGDFEKSLEMIRDLRPENLRLHALAASSLAVNQRLRVYLLMGETKKAEEQMEHLRLLLDTAAGRVPALISGLRDCIRLAEAWMDFQQGKACDEAYIREERDLAKNKIHKSEMQLLLARMKLEQGEKERAEEIFRELTKYSSELYAGKEAVRILNEDF